MIGFSEFRSRWRFWVSADRLGPDIPATHWRLYFLSTMRKLCAAKFKAFGTGAEFRPGAYAIGCSRICLGDRVTICPGCMLFADPREGGEGIVIESDVLLGSGVHIYVVNHAFGDPDTPIIDQGHSPSAAVTIRRGAWIGAGVIILPGVTIGRNAVVGAGSVVTRDVPDQSIAVGNPARSIRRIEKENQAEAAVLGAAEEDRR